MVVPFCPQHRPCGQYRANQLIKMLHSQESKEKNRIAHLGKKMSLETRKKMSESATKKGFGKWMKGRVVSSEIRKKMSEGQRGKIRSEDTRRKMSNSKLGIKMPQISGKNHHKWIMDRSKLVKRQERNDVAYKEWRKKVWLRDNFKCKIANPDCSGRIEAHHILSWKDFPDLRYSINNGITLCHKHHPKKRIEEINLSSYFQKIIIPNLT